MDNIMFDGEVTLNEFIEILVDLIKENPQYGETMVELNDVDGIDIKLWRKIYETADKRHSLLYRKKWPWETEEEYSKATTGGWDNIGG
jgi:hypothetical protein